MDENTYSNVALMVHQCEEYRNDLSSDRTTAMEYYDGEMTDTPADPGRSKVIKRSLRAAVKKVLPAMVRTILGNDEVVKFQPVGEEDEEACAQASDYINYVVLPESNGFNAIYDAIHDAARLRNGILSWQYKTENVVTFSRHTGLPEEEFVALAGDDDVEVIEHSPRPEIIETEEGPIEVVLHDCRIKRREEKKAPLSVCVPLEEFLIHPDATCIEDSPITGRKSRLKRSDLVSMGYDRETVEGLPAVGRDTEEEGERDDRRAKNYHFDGNDNIESALQEVDYYDLYVRTDKDGDGIAELRHMCFGGSVKEEHLLLDEECDDVPFADISIERRPHQWEGHSIADDVMEIQRIETVLLRETLDNIYWQNTPQPIFQNGKIKNPEAVFNPEFGRPIEVEGGVDVRAALGFNKVPFMAKESFAMLEYMDNELTDRTGISDASSGLAPDALQNMTAKATGLVEQAGVAQSELMARNIANGLKKYFRGLLRMVIRHQDVPRTVRLRGKWAKFDPRHWNADMDCIVNTGLGAGTRERDMIMMKQVIGLQEKILASMGADNPFVKPDNLYEAITKFVEAAGLRTPTLYFTEPDPQEIQAKLEAMRNQPNPEQLKAEAQIKIEEAKLASAQKAKQMEMVANASKEKAQMDADLKVKQAELEKESIARNEKLQNDAWKEGQRLAFEREKLLQERELKIMELEQQRELEMARMEREQQRAQAGDIGKAIERMTTAQPANTGQPA